MVERPIGIIKTLPSSTYWSNEFEKDLMKLNNDPDAYWIFSINGKPKYEVLYFFILINGSIRFRGNIAGYKEIKKPITCFDGSIRTSKLWVIITAPIVKLKPIKMKGFQGFRYTEKLF
jgi:hypothetical protein